MLHSEQSPALALIEADASHFGHILRSRLRAGGLFATSALLAGCGFMNESVPEPTSIAVTSPGPTATTSQAPEVPGTTPTPTPTESPMTETPNPLKTAEAGIQGEYIGYIQGMLIVVNCLPEGDDDTYMGKQTKEAVERFQRSSDLTETGRIVEDDPTETALISSAAAEEKVCMNPAPPDDPPATPVPTPTCILTAEGAQRPINPGCPPRPSTTAQTP